MLTVSNFLPVLSQTLRSEGKSLPHHPESSFVLVTIDFHSAESSGQVLFLLETCCEHLMQVSLFLVYFFMVSRMSCPLGFLPLWLLLSSSLSFSYFSLPLNLEGIKAHLFDRLFFLFTFTALVISSNFMCLNTKESLV